MKNKGFTLVELLIVVVVVGILAGVVLVVLNPSKQQNVAKEATSRSNLEKLVLGIESYYAVEGIYPTVDQAGNPTSVLRTVYLKQWPTQPTGTVYTYFVDGLNFGVRVNKPETGCIKYHSSWRKMQDCTSCGDDTSCL